MFYAIKYAYGSTVVNNGPRADDVFEFSQRRLRDAWVSAGPPDISASGYRASASARHPIVRAADSKRDGDDEAWYILASSRVDASPTLATHRDAILDSGWREKDHLAWVARAPERDIVRWAKQVAK